MMSWLRKARRFLPQEIRGPLAALYERVAIPGLRGFHRRVASEIASALTRGRVLDVGTGPGHLLVEIARHRPRVKLVGVDLSPTMLGIAGDVLKHEIRACGESGTERHDPTSDDISSCLRSIRLVRGDVRDLPFPDGAFDLVVSTLSLHHWHDRAAGIRECMRVTAPGGQCWIYDLRSDVSAKTHAEMVTGSRLRRLLLGWVFRFHSIHPGDFDVDSVSRELGRDMTVRLELMPTYLKLNMAKGCKRPSEGSRRSGQHRAFALGVDASSSASAGPLS